MNIPSPTPGVSCKLLLQSSEASKVISHDIHPSRPWVVTAHENHNVTLWDYETQNILFSFFVADLDEAAREQLNHVRTAERSGDFKGPKEAEGQLKSMEKVKMGAMRSVVFLDRATQKQAFLLRERIRAIKEQGAADLPAPVLRPAPTPGDSPNTPERRERRPTIMAAESRRFHKDRKQQTDLLECNYIVILTEHRLILYDYMTHFVKEFSPSNFDIKPMLSCSTIGIGGLIAVTGSDGLLRIFDSEKMMLVKKFPCGKQAEFVLGFDDTNGHKTVITTSHGGVIQWWLEVDSLKGDGSEKPTHTQSHGGDICSLSINNVECHLITASTDRTVAAWDMASSREISRMKPKSKHVYYGLAGFEHPKFPRKSILGTLKDDSKLYMTYPEEDKNNTVELIDVNEFPNSQKKNKIHGVGVHPAHSHLIACITRMGLCVVSISAGVAPPSVILGGNQVVVAYQSQLQTLDVKSGKSVVVRPFPGWGTLNVSASPTGRYLAVWNGRVYQVLDVSSDPWKVADEGPALDIVWAGPKHPLRYAYLAPPVTAAEDDSRKKKKKVKAAKTSTQTTKALPTVVIKEFDENRYARPITEDATVKFLVSGLFGGTLLGLSMVPDESQMTNRIAARMSQITVSSSPMPSPATGTLRGAVRARHGTVSAAFSKPPPQVSTVAPSDSDYINRCFTLMDWSGENVIAEDLPVPNNVIWEKNNSFCAMIYDEYFCTFELRPAFRLLTRHNEVVRSGHWHASAAFIYVTETHMKMFLPGNANTPPTVIASIDPVEAELISLVHGTKQLTCHLLPPHGCTILGCSESTIHLLATGNVLYHVNISSPKLLLQLAVASGAPDRAMEYSNDIPPEEHDDIADVFRAFKYGHHAVKLSGLSPLLKFEMAAEAGAFDVALPALTAAISEVQGDEVKEREMSARCLQIVAELKTAGDKGNIIAEILRRVAQSLDRSVYKSLTLHYVEEKDILALRTLYDSLVLDELWDYAKFTALFIGEDGIIKNACMQGGNYADAFAFLGDGEDADVIAEKLDGAIQAQQRVYRKEIESASTSGE